MRPSILFPLFAPLTSLKGLGPRLAPLYARLCGGAKVVDLLWHLPSGVIDRTYAPSLCQAEKNRVATIELTVLEHKPNARAGKPYRVIATDGTDEITLNFFTAKGDYLSKVLPCGGQTIVSGLLERFGHGWTMSHPDYILPPALRGEIQPFEPVYALTEGLSRKMVGKTIRQALDKLPPLVEWHDPHLMAREKWPAWSAALLEAHAPKTENEITSPSPARRRLAYDELLADQLALALIRKHNRLLGGRSIEGTGVWRKALLAALPFDLTQGQKTALAEIEADMAAPKRMLRLLQGDVGSGKTIVALLAMLQALESGLQAALMVPTELLARQHMQRLRDFLAPLGIRVGLLVGKGRSKTRGTVLDELEKGTLQLVVGTHALFQEDVVFANLGLAVMDEQHRFGVHQRLQLSAKGKGVDILVMTATPIPRTLTLTAYGDMDVSRILDKPEGRKSIDTRLVDMARLEEVVGGVMRATAKGAQAYWVCPLVEESEKSDLAAATQRAELLRLHFGMEGVGLIHGRMKAEEKEKTMAAFLAGEIKVLVATTVIEVGVDVANASLMIVEHAERFGLAQLHQLRGRVGRGAAKSVCLLLYQKPLGEIAKARLSMMRESEDGFRLAEEDLKLRGPGELLGTRQSGLPVFRMADLLRDKDLLKMAHDDAALVLAADGELGSGRGLALRTLLYLFEKDAAAKLFRAG